MEMILPDLRYNFTGAQIESVRVGPRREATLVIRALLWEGSRGYRSPDIYLRFGGIANFDEVRAFFARCPTLEVARIDYATSRPSKPGNLFLELAAERTDDRLIVQCSNVTVTDSD